MAKQPKVTILSFAQVCMMVNFHDAAIDFPRESFAQVTRRLLGAKGFADAPNIPVYQRECREAFSLGRKKK